MRKLSKLFLVLLLLFFLPYSLFADNIKGKNLVLDKDQGLPKWKKNYNSALALYKKGKYSKAIKILDEIIPLLLTRKEIIEARFIQAQCSFKSKDYISSKYQFEEVYDDYPASVYAEESLYMLAFSLYKRSPSIDFGQKVTKDAIQIFDYYLIVYPNGKFHVESKKYLNELNKKLLKKEIDIAKCYYNLEYYVSTQNTLESAIPTFSRIIPNSKLIIKAEWMLLESVYYEAKSTDKKRRKPKLIKALEYAVEFLSKYSNDTKYTKKAKKLFNKIQNSINKF